MALLAIIQIIIKEDIIVRILITGITGFAGGHLATQLAKDKNLTLYGVVRNASGLLPSLQSKVTCFTGNLLSEAFVSEVLTETKPDVIYHLAGQAFVPQAWAAPWETIKLNVLPQLHLFKGLVALNLRPRFLSVTSSKVYGEAISDSMPLKETIPLRPDHPYGLSKATQDLMAQQYYLSHQIPTIRARSFNHVGPRQNPNFVSAEFAKQIAQAEKGLRPPLVRVGNLTPARDFSDVRDVVKAYIALVERGQAGHAYNVGSGNAVVIQTILDHLISLSHIKITVEQDPAKMRPVDYPISYGDISKIKADTGWQPEIPLKQSLEDILEYWREETSKEAGEA